MKNSRSSATNFFRSDPNCHYPAAAFLSCFLLVVASLLVSCKKDIDAIGLNLQDGTLNANYIEIPITAYATLEDSIYTKNLIYNIIGDVHDPIFGETKSGFCAQFALQGSNTSFQNAVLDSVVLTLQYADYYGDTLSGLQMEVYHLNEPLTRENYYSHDNQPQVQSENLAANASTIYPQPKTRVFIDSLATAPHMRVRLADHFGNYLLQLPSTTLATTTNFQSEFYGLVVKATANGTGNLCYISPTAATTGIVLYYKVNGVAKKYTFPIATHCTRYSFFTHDYTNASNVFRQQVISGDTTLGRDLLYAQPLSGVKTHINLSPLADWCNGKRIIINKAELILTNVSPNETYFTQPSNLGLQRVLANGTTGYVPDDATYTSTSYFGGSYDAKTNEYRFRLTYYAQEILRQGKVTDNGLNVVVSGAGIRGNRLLFRGTDATYTDRLRLAIYYTEY